MKPSEAAKIAREWSVNHIDPLAEADCGFNRSKHRFLDPSQANPLENAVIIKHIEEVRYED